MTIDKLSRKLNNIGVNAVTSQDNSAEAVFSCVPCPRKGGCRNWQGLSPRNAVESGFLRSGSGRLLAKRKTECRRGTHKSDAPELTSPARELAAVSHEQSYTVIDGLAPRNRGALEIEADPHGAVVLQTGWPNREHHPMGLSIGETETA